MKKGFQRVKIDGAFYEIAEAPALDKKFKHDIDVVVDRIVVRADIGTRLADSLETALKLADGLAVVEFADTAPADRRRRPTSGRNDNAERLIFSEKFACPVSGFTIPRSSRGCSRSTTRSAPARPATASASSSTSTPTWSSPTSDATLRKGAIAPWAKSSSPYYIQTLEALGKALQASRSTPSGRTCRRRPRTRSSTAPARTTITLRLRRRPARLRRPRSRSRASSPTSSAASRRPRATGRARSCRNISPTSPARPATATA